MTADPKPDAVTADLPCHEYGYAADVDKAEAWDALSAKNAEITRLREQLAEAERQRDAARAEALEEGLKRAAKDRATFCTAMVGTDEEFRAYLDGFDAAIRALIKEDRK